MSAKESPEFKMTLNWWPLLGIGTFIYLFFAALGYLVVGTYGIAYATVLVLSITATSLVGLIPIGGPFIFLYLKDIVLQSVHNVAPHTIPVLDSWISGYGFLVSIFLTVVAVLAIIILIFGKK